MKRLERKVGFLMMELNDVKNNKGTLTLQVKSVEHLENWIKKRVVGGDLAIKPLDISLALLQMHPVADIYLLPHWWEPKSAAATLPQAQSTTTGYKEEHKKNMSEILEIARKQHMNTDIKKAVFQAIVSSEDYVQAFENLTRLNLKKQQEREIIKVLVHCCVQEKNLFNRFYGLLA